MAASGPNTHFFFSATILIVVGILFFAGNSQVTAQSCGNDVGDLVSKCQQYVQKSGPKTPPSQDCCAVVKKVNVPCVCGLVTKSIESLISMEKVVYVARYCGKTVPSGTKCGSYTVPPA